MRAALSSLPSIVIALSVYIQCVTSLHSVTNRNQEQYFVLNPL